MNPNSCLQIVMGILVIILSAGLGAVGVWFGGNVAKQGWERLANYEQKQGHSIDKSTRLEQSLSVHGSSIGGDVVLGNKSVVSQDPEGKLLKRRQAIVRIKRLYEDFLSYLTSVLEQHRKDIDQVAQRYVFHSTYSSGLHLREQYELARKRRREISGKWLELKRGVEDELFEADQSELVDAEMKAQQSISEEAGKRAQKEILDMTHNYFTSRSATFSTSDLER